MNVQFAQAPGSAQAPEPGQTPAPGRVPGRSSEPAAKPPLLDGKRAVVALLIALAVTAFMFGAALFTMIGASAVAASDASYRTLDYDVTVQPDGRLTVVQHIDMRLDRRTDSDDNVRPYKQLYQQYRIDASNLTDITDVSVVNASTGETYTQTDPQNPNAVSDATWDSDYARHWYIADVTGSAGYPQPYVSGQGGAANPTGAGVEPKTVEVGWNIPATEQASSLKFDVTMTLAGTMTLYDDVASFQWEPVGPTNQIPIGTLTGTVRFPEGIGADNSWAWLHYAGTSETGRTADGGLTFTAHDVRSDDYLDLVAAFDADALHAPDSADNADNADWIRRLPGNHLDALKADEANQELQWRDKQRTRARIRLAVWLATAIIGLLLSAIALVSAVRSRRDAHYRGDIEYWREPPDMSPASAARMIGALGLAKGAVNNRQMTATILSLASKKAIAIYPGSADLYRGVDMSRANPVALAGMIGADSSRVNAARGTSTLVLEPVVFDATGRAGLNLSPSEEAALRLLQRISERVGAPVFDLNQMTYACRDWRDGYKTLGAFESACANEFAALGATRSGGVGALIAGIIGFLTSLAAAIAFIAVYTNYALACVVAAPIMIASVFALAYRSGTRITDAGQPLAGQVLGLYRYLTDFSDFTDRGAADLTLWDRYLVYAAAFGISDRVARELAKAYPEVTDPDWLDANASDSTLYWTYRSYGWHHYTATGPSAGSHHDGAGDFGGFGGSGASAFAGDFGSIGAQLDAGFADISSTIQAAAPSSSDSSGSGSFGSGGSFSGGGFGGSSGGSGGGSFGAR